MGFSGLTVLPCLVFVVATSSTACSSSSEPASRSSPMVKRACAAFDHAQNAADAGMSEQLVLAHVRRMLAAIDKAASKDMTLVSLQEAMHNWVDYAKAGDAASAQVQAGGIEVECRTE